MAFSIPTPCSAFWPHMTPTPDGRFCGKCQHEVVDFSRMTEAEVTAWLARPATENVCGFFQVGQFTPAAAQIPRWRRWLLAVAAVLSLKPLLLANHAAASTLPSGAGPTEQAHDASSQNTVTIRGRVLDDATGEGVVGATIFIGNTKYGTITDAQGNFSFTMRRKWAPVHEGQVQLQVNGVPFEFKPQMVTVALSSNPKPLVITLQSMDGRGHIMGKIRPIDPPKKPPL